MRHYSLLLVFFVFCFFKINAQSIQEFKVFFSEGETALSMELDVDETHLNYDHPFVGISAFTKDDVSQLKSLEYRIGLKNNWGEWLSFKTFHEGNLIDRASFEGPFIEDSFDQILFRKSGDYKGQFNFRLFFPKSKKEISHKSKKLESSCSCVLPFYCDRNCWCSDSSCPADQSPTPTVPTHLVVHHSAGSNSSNDWAAVVAYIWDLHVNTNGWDDIGYNWLIDPNGVIYEGRGNGAQGAHFSCMNGNTTGVCLLGNFENQSPPILAIDALKEFLAWEACDKNIIPSTSTFHNSSQLNLEHISGHRDGNSSSTGCPKGTACPGDSLYILLPSIRTDLAANPCLNGVGSEEHKFLNDLEIFPNPAVNLISLKLNEHIAAQQYYVEILSGSGKTVLTEKVDFSNSVKIDVSEFSSGIYLLNIETDSGTIRQKFNKL